MKSCRAFFKLLLLPIILGLFLIACSKDNDPGITKGFRWSLNGVPYSSATGTHAVKPAGSSVVVLNGVVIGVSQIQINLENCDKVGTYIAEKPGPLPNSAYVFLSVGSEYYNTENNTITEKLIINVTQLSLNNIQGTINGTVRYVTATGAGPAYSLKGEFNLALLR